MSFTVTLAPGGRSFQVEKNESVLDAALREGIALPYGCRSGTCSSCRAKVLSGEIVYRDEPPKALRDGDAEAGWGICQ